MATPGQPTPIPSKEELIAKLKEEPDAWNEWWMGLGPDNRKQIDLTGANLKAASLKDRKLCDANLARSDLTRADLSGADLSGANLRNIIGNRVVLTDGNLTGANIAWADLYRATLQYVKFGGADLRGANLGEADLRDADLSEIKCGLLSGQLAGANLTGAKLPEPTAKLYENLGSVSDISDSAKKLFLALLAACVYSWLTIGTTKDVDLITNRASSPLPIIQTAIPIVGFYVIAPIILICIYFYFHFYLQKLWEELATLPAIFTDGRRLHERADPWLFNDLVRAHFPKLKWGRPFLSYFQQWISVLLAWWVVPITLLLFWGRYLPRHDLFWTIVLAIILAISIVSAIQLYRLARETLGGSTRTPFKWTKLLKRGRTYWDLLRAICIATLLIVISRAAIFGTPDGWMPRAIAWVRYSPFARLSDADVSVKPPNWTGKKEEELDEVKGANLSGQDLRYASAQRAFLVKAELRGADLTNADLSDALLSHAHLLRASMNNSDLEHADLKHAFLASAKLHSANLMGAHLTRATLVAADLSGANLNSADLTQANLRRAKLQEAQLLVASLTGAKFPGANFTGAELNEAVITYADFRGASGLTLHEVRGCYDWQMAFFDNDMLKQLGLPEDHNHALEDYEKSGPQEQFGSLKSKWYAHELEEYRKSGAQEPFDRWEWIRYDSEWRQAHEAYMKSGSKEPFPVWLWKWLENKPKVAVSTKSK